MVTGLPLVDLHLHQESSPRLDRVMAIALGTEPFDWPGWLGEMTARTPAGIARLRRLATVHPVPQEIDAHPEWFIARHVDIFTEAAEDGAVFIEVRCGRKGLRRPDFMELFREAEQRVQRDYPNFHAEPVMMIKLWYPEEELRGLATECVRLADAGLAGVDFVYEPYDIEADWSLAYRLAERLSASGLGITAHAGEFGTANIEAALKVPGLTRLGHGVHAVSSPRLLDLIREAGVALECCLTSNAVLGATEGGYESHPLKQLLAAGIPVALGSDDPVQLSTSIGREYEWAAKIGLSQSELWSLSANGLRYSFTKPDRKRTLLAMFRNGDDRR